MLADKFITILFCEHKKFNVVSTLIRLIQKSDFSHVILKFHSDSLNRDLFYDATGLGLSFKNFTEVDDIYSIAHKYQIPASNEQYLKSLQWCVDNVHKKYGFSQVLYILLNFLFSKIGIKIPVFVKNQNKRMICDEVAINLLIEVFGEKVDINPDIADLNWLKSYLDQKYSQQI